MPKVFISYRQESEAHRGQVRALAERLRTRLAPRGIEIVLDQFLLDQKHGGPTEGWPKWSAEQVKEAGRVVMIASPGWVDCFTGKESPEAGAGAACEAHVIWQGFYSAHWKTDKFRVCLFERSQALSLPDELKGFHSFFSPDDDEGLCAWLAELAPAGPNSTQTAQGGVTWPAIRRDFKHGLADREKVFAFFREMLAGQSAGKRILLIRADTKESSINNFYLWKRRFRR